MTFDPNRPFNDLPDLPPASETETRAILRSCIAARASLAELRVSGTLIPNQAMLINSIPLLEAQASSEIENIVTTADRLFRYANDTTGRADPATKEALRYRTALHRGFEMLNQRPVSTAVAVEVCRTIKGVELDIRTTPGAALVNDATQQIIYTPPEGEDVLRSKLANWERYIHETGEIDPLIRLAVMHYQFEAIHPYADGNGRLGRVLVTRALRRADLTRRTTVPVSVAIARDPGGYLSGLAQFEQGRAGPWIRWFAEVAEKAAAATGSLAAQTRHITEAWARRLHGLRADSAARALVPLLAGHPVLCAPDAADLLGVSRPAARTALRALTDRAVLAPVEADSPGVGRNRHWFAAVDLINAWSG